MGVKKQYRIKNYLSKKDVIDFISNLDKLNSHLRKSKGRDYIWGIDISLSNTALAYYKISEDQFYAMSHKFKGSRYFRLKKLEKSFDKHIVKKIPKLAVIENYAFGSKFSREIVGEASYAVKRCFLRTGLSKNDGYVPTLLVSPMSLKKFVLCESSRGSKKNDIHKLVSKDWGAQTKNNDESDAFVLLMIGTALWRMSKVISKFNMLRKSLPYDYETRLKIFQKMMKRYHLVQQKVLVDILRDNVAKREVYKRKGIKKITFSDEVGRFYPIDEN